MNLSFWSWIAKYRWSLLFGGIGFLFFTVVGRGYHVQEEAFFWDLPEFYGSEDFGARQLHQVGVPILINGLADTLNGQSVVIAVGDDGFVDPHIDLQNRLDQSFVDQSGINHEDMVVGILAGAGNLDPKARGIAPKAQLVLLDNFEAIQLADQLVNDQSVSIISISQGDGCNTGYTFLARQADQFARQKPFLIQVFSAGNFAVNGCGHPFGAPWYSISGGVKQSKNSLSIGNLDANLNLVTTSSHGPAYDGRLKPELVAIGDGQRTTSANNQYQIGGGTSAAAPTVAGQFALLAEGYRKLYDQIPDNALLKAVVMNTARDWGPSGPDFQSGFGLPSVAKAWSVLQQAQFGSTNLSDGQIHQSTINVPAGQSTLKIMLHWTDREADLAAAKALVNNLDLRVIDPTGQVHLPLVPDPSDSALINGVIAQPGIDSLNTMEQVVIETPEAGAYTIEIKASNIPSGLQEAHWSWFWEASILEWTSPLADLAFEPGDTIRVYWENRANETPVEISYQIEGQSTWTSLATNVADPFWDWPIDPNLFGRFRLRLTAGAVQSTGSDWFWIAPKPAAFQVIRACSDSVRLSWQTQAIGTDYFIYRMGEQFMEIVDSTKADSIDLGYILNDTSWFAIQSRSP
ncbi:MAG: S8 family serine peptidase, partial [Bacteroidota bacterium]